MLTFGAPGRMDRTLASKRKGQPGRSTRVEIEQERHLHGWRFRFSYLPAMLASAPLKVYTQDRRSSHATRGARSPVNWGSVWPFRPDQILHGKTPTGASGHWSNSQKIPLTVRHFDTVKRSETRARRGCGATTPVR